MSKLFLLSEDEAKNMPKSILSCGKWWWLRSPGNHSSLAMGVSDYGYVDRRSDDSVIRSDAVRPALLLSSPLSEYKFKKTKKGYIKLGRKPNGKTIKWIDISEYIGKPCLLMKKPFEYHRFDTESNIYETSEIKKRLDELDEILGFTDLDIVLDWEDN